MAKNLCFLLVLFLIAGCSGGGSESPDSTASQPATGPQAPPQASLLWRSAAGGLVRSQTDGTGQIVLDSQPVQRFPVIVSGSTIVYNTGTWRDVWTVQTNGSGRQAVVSTEDDEILDAVVGGWAIYRRQAVEIGPTPLWSGALDGRTSHVLASSLSSAYERSLNGRVMWSESNTENTTLSSIQPDGTDQRLLDEIPRGNHGVFTFLGTRGTVGNQVIYSVLDEQFVPDLFAVPVTGGTVVTLADSQDYEWLGAVVGNRVVYHRCPVQGATILQCDISSVSSNGSGTVILSNHPENETVQGVIGSRVIVRRNSGATDTLYSIPAGGGAETPMLTIDAQTEFVVGIVEDRVILRRPTGLWSLRADGESLTQLTNQVDELAGSAGEFVCFARGQTLWCVPADGSAEPTQVTDNGVFVEGL